MSHVQYRDALTQELIPDERVYESPNGTFFDIFTIFKTLMPNPYDAHYPITETLIPLDEVQYIIEKMLRIHPVEYLQDGLYRRVLPTDYFHFVYPRRNAYPYLNDDGKTDIKLETTLFFIYNEH